MSLKRIPLLFFIFFILMSLWIPQAPVSAVNFTVDATTPYVNGGDGLCSLVEAIDNANADALTHADCPAGAGADVISLTGNIVLDGTVTFAGNGVNGLPSITSDITIEGNTFAIQRVGAISFRPLHVDVTGTLTLNNVTVSGGFLNTGFDNGGGIYNNGILNLNHSAVSNNRVESIFPSGGGIYSTNTGTLNIVDSVIQNNVANSAGSVFDNGGGIYSLGALNMTHGIVQGNNAEEAGGGIWAGGNTIINNSVISGNSAIIGGGMLSFGIPATMIRINNSTFTGNTAIDNGGALLNGNDDLEIFGSTFSNNAVQGNPNGTGGAITNLGGTMLITASRFQGNQALNNAIGGAISNLQLGVITLRGSLIEGNSSATFGGGLTTGLAEFFIFDSLITGNTAQDGGGGLYQTASNIAGFTITRTTVSNNSATTGIGGGLLQVSNASTATVINSTFTGNTAGLLGGGIGLNSGGVVDILHSTIVENSSTQFINSVGGINAFAGTMTIGSTIVANNMNTDCSATGASTSLDYNITTGPGGGIPVNRWCSFVPLQPNDQLNTNPLLNPLGANGNIGQTYTLQVGSPAIDAVPINCPASLNDVDQRGVPRPAGSCDVGAISDDAVIMPEVYFETPATLIDNENTVVTPQTINLIIDNTNGTLPTIGNVPLTIYVTITGTATDTADYNSGIATPTAFTFNAGNWVAPGTSQVIPITLNALDDLFVEGDETIQYTVSLTGPGSIRAGQNQHLVTIIDDDVPPPIVVNNPTPNITIFDPSISKIGFLRPGELGVTGEQLEWFITVSNPSAAVGTNVVITDTLRPELRVDNVTTSRGTTNVSGQTVTVTIPSLNPGEQVQIRIFTQVLDGVSIVENTACVNADNQIDERCATALPVTSLPQTGESPWWRSTLIIMLLSVSIASLWGWSQFASRER